jgi:hydrogenase maturation protease
MRTLVLGIGNPILSDDGVGVRVVESLKNEFSDPNVDFRCESISGLDLVEIVRGYDRLIIVDAIQTGKEKVGEVMKLTAKDLSQLGTIHFSTLHDIDMLTALRLGKEIGAKMPERVIIYAIEVEDIVDFCEELTPEVKKAVPEAVNRLKEELSTP